MSPIIAEEILPRTQFNLHECNTQTDRQTVSFICNPHLHVQDISGLSTVKMCVISAVHKVSVCELSVRQVSGRHCED